MPYARKTRPALYGFSTCGRCAKAQAWLDGNVGDYDLVYVDLLDDNTQMQTMAELEQKADPVTFPLIDFGGAVVSGYLPQDYQSCLDGQA